MCRLVSAVSRKSNISEEKISARAKIPAFRGRSHALAWGKDLLTTTPDEAVTLACLGLKPAAIHDLDIAAAVADQSRGLEIARDERHAARRPLRTVTRSGSSAVGCAG